MENKFEIASRLSSALDDSDDAFIELSNSISSDIEAGKIKLFEAIAELESYLTSTQISDRLNGVRFLSSVLSKLPPSYLTDQEINLITTFYCERLLDHHTLTSSSILGLSSIVKMKNLPKDAPLKIFHSLSQNVRCQSEDRETRENIYTIFKNLLDTRIEDLKSIGPDFIFAIITAIDPESDPRNLLLLFTFLPHLFKNFPLGHLTEEMFDCLSRYFPVDFNPQPSKGQAIITREDLSKGLEDCLSAIPEFSEYCIPLVIDKLSSDVKLAKIESLRLLTRGSSVFGVEGLKHHLDELWPLLRGELLPGNDQDIRQAGLLALENIITVISSDSTISQRFVSLIISDIKSSLSDIELSLFDPAEKIFKTIARASKDSCYQVLAIFVPMCLAQYSTKQMTTDKASLLESLNGFIDIASGHGFAVSDVPTLAWTDIPGLYLDELSSKEVILRAKAFAGLSIQKSFLNQTQRMKLYDSICQEIDAGCPELKGPCHKVLAVFTKHQPSEILKLFESRLKINDETSTVIMTICRISALASIADIPSVGPAILPKIIQATCTDSDDINSTALSCLEELVQLQQNNEFNIHEFLQNNCKIVDRLVASSRENNQKNVGIISRICCLVVRQLSVEEQKKLITQHYESLVKQISEEIVLLEGLMTPLDPSVSFLYVTDYLLENLLDLSLGKHGDGSTISSCKLLAVLINKMKEDPKFGKFLDVFRERIVDVLEANDDAMEGGVLADCQGKKWAVVLLAWITKGLITRGSLRAQDFLDMYFNTLKMEDIGEYAGEKINILIDKNEATLTTENSCSIKIFYKQRIFQNFLQQYEQFKDDSAQNYLIALVHLVEEIPMELLLLNLSKIVPLLIKVLSLNNEKVILLVLKTLKPMIDTKHQIFAEQIGAFLPASLNLVKHPRMHIRIAALDCIDSYCNYPNEIIKLYKEDVLDKLAAPLDDAKRLVRKIATKSRTRWFLVGAPGGKE